MNEYNQLSVEICKHRYGKKITYTEQTDGVAYNTSYLPIRDMLGNNGIRGGIFLSLKDLKTKYVQEVFSDRKLIWADEYSSIYPSFSWKLMNKVKMKPKQKNISEKEWSNYYKNSLLPPFLSVFGRKPVALSYAYGNDSFKDYQTQYLGARNSGTDGNTNYGRECGNHPEAYQPECFKSRKSTLRWYDETVALIRANNQVGGGNYLTIR